MSCVIMHHQLLSCLDSLLSSPGAHAVRSAARVVDNLQYMHPLVVHRGNTLLSIVYRRSGFAPLRMSVLSVCVCVCVCEPFVC